MKNGMTTVHKKHERNQACENWLLSNYRGYDTMLSGMSRRQRRLARIMVQAGVQTLSVRQCIAQTPKKNFLQRMRLKQAYEKSLWRNGETC